MVLRTKVNIVSWITFLLLVSEMNVGQQMKMNRVKGKIAHSKSLVPTRMSKKTNRRG